MKNKSTVRKLMIPYIAFLIYWNYRQCVVISELVPQLFVCSLWDFIEINIGTIIVLAAINGAVWAAGKYIRTNGKTREILTEEQKKIMRTIYKCVKVVLWIVIIYYVINAFSQVADMIEGSDGYWFNLFLIYLLPAFPWEAVETVLTDICKLFSEKIEEEDEETEKTEVAVETNRTAECGDDQGNLEGILTGAAVDKEPNETVESEVVVEEIGDFAEYFFGSDEKSLRGKYDGRAGSVWNRVCDYLAAGTTGAEYQETMEAQARKCNYVATEKNNRYFADKVIENVGIRLGEGEHILFYMDDGVLSKGKEGLLVTTKNIYRVGKWNVYTVEHAEVATLKKIPMSISWYINEIVDMSVGSVNATDEFNAMTVAYVVMLARKASGKAIEVN